MFGDQVAAGGRSKAGRGRLAPMFRALANLLLYRLLGARLMLGLAILGWLRRRLLSWQASQRAAATRVYQPSQGSSQIVHRDPR
jgi:hypothetical protein